MVEGMRVVVVDDSGEADARGSASLRRATAPQAAPGPSVSRPGEPEPSLEPTDVDGIIDSVLGGRDAAQTGQPAPEHDSPWDALSGVDQPPAGPILLLPPSDGGEGGAR